MPSLTLIEDVKQFYKIVFWTWLRFFSGFPWHGTLPSPFLFSPINCCFLFIHPQMSRDLSISSVYHEILHWYITLSLKSNKFKCSHILRSRRGQCFEVQNFHHNFYCLKYTQLVEVMVTWHEPFHSCCPALCIDGAHIKLQFLVCIMFLRPILALHLFFSLPSILLLILQLPG